MGVTPSEALRLMLEYIADNERLPFKLKRISFVVCLTVTILSSSLQSGYRLVYQVIDEKVVVFVISVGK